MTKKEVFELVQKRLNEKYLNHDLKALGWKFGGFDKSTTHSGVCKPRTKEIMLSERFLEYMDYGQINNTVLHEIAHAIDFTERNCSGHDSVWRMYAIAIGCNPDYHFDIEKVARETDNAIFRKYKYKIKCPNHGVLGGLMRKPKRIYSCAKCGEKVKIIENYK
jgi:predicted SprT family Zn-dependent metalloprotease